MVLESYNNYTATCPGSLMIMGEHAVLYGSPAIVAAIDKYLTVTLTTSLKKKPVAQIEIISDINKFINANLEAGLNFNVHDLEQTYLSCNKSFIYILGVIKHFKEQILSSELDYKFNITSQINPTMGLGSSAAVTAASIAVIAQALGLKLNKQDLLSIARIVITDVQGKGSGADLAASIYGKVIRYQMSDQKVEIIADSIPLAVVYCGYKLSTKEVIRIIAEQMNNNSLIYHDIFELINKIVEQALIAIKNQNWSELGKLFNQHYGLQEALGTSDVTLANIIYSLCAQHGVYGAKISGSGLGDCVIGLGKITNFDCSSWTNSQYLDINISDKGLV